MLSGMATAPPPLDPLPEDWERALCVVAHPDDLEFGAAAAIARWTAQGKQVGYCMVTSGEAGIDGMEPDRCREVREAEQRESARIVGVPEVDFLGFPDGVLEYGLPLRAAIAQEVRRFRPEIVITGNFRDTWGGRSLNQADHIAVGRAVLDARTRRRQPLGLPRTAHRRPGALGRCPRGLGVRLAGVDPRRRHHRHLRSRRRLLAAHAAYIEGLGWENWDPREFLEGFARQTGQRMGVGLAAAFEVFPMGFGE